MSRSLDGSRTSSTAAVRRCRRPTWRTICIPIPTSTAAVALPDEYLGEKICAAVVFRGRPITLAELNAFLDERGVSAHARPDALVAMPALPTTAVGKVDKKQVVARLMADKNG